MGVNALQYGISVLAFAIFFYVLYVGHRESLVRVYPLFYLFVAWSVLRGVFRWLVLFYWGYDSSLYYHVYYILALVTPLIQILLLIQIYYQVKCREDRGHWVVLGVFTAMMSVYLLRQQEANFYIVFNTIALYFQVLFCLLVHVQWQRNRQVYLGRNYSGILYGLSLMIALQSINYGLRLFEYLSVQPFLTVLQVLGLIPWIGYVLCMRRLDGPRVLEPELAGELAALETNLRKAVSLIR